MRTSNRYSESANKLPFMTPEVMAEFDPARVVRISPLVRRITAPNPSVMTGPGTNCFLVGNEEVAVIDPGIDDPAHLKRIAAAGDGKIRWILVTHAHPDHSPGANYLKDLTGAEILGYPEKQKINRDVSFNPDRYIQEGYLIQSDEFIIRCLHTPGHASDHICFLLEQEKMLFAGDHVMDGVTVVITPPDGNMADYLDSLQRLVSEEIDVVAPAHGRINQNPKEKFQEIIEHRLEREGKIIESMQQLGPATIRQIVSVAYTDVPQFLHEMAGNSVLAHLLKMKGEGRADGQGKESIWSLQRGAPQCGQPVEF